MLIVENLMKGKWQLCEDQGAMISVIRHSKNKDYEVETNLGLFLGLEVGVTVK